MTASTLMRALVLEQFSAPVNTTHTSSKNLEISIMSNFPSLAGKVAVVNGANRGIGQGIATVHGEQGARVYVTGRTTAATPNATARPHLSATLCIVLLLSTCGALSAQNEQHRVRNIVLVHGAWADGSAWKGVYDILVEDG